MVRIGQGIDFHRFVPGDGLIFGGVVIPGERSLEAHSDGDIVLHSIMDSILGALALGDIGELFPDNNPIYQDAKSSELLKEVLKYAEIEGFTLVNLDITVISEFPKILHYRDAIRNNLSELLGLNLNRISIKGTTSEKLGFIGREEGVGVFVSILLEN